MKSRAVTVLLLALSPLLSPASQPGLTANAPIINFKLPVLNEQGFRTSLFRGNEARYIDDNHIDFVSMQYTVFKADGTNAIESTLLAPSASVFINDRHYKVQGSEGVRIIRDDLDLVGTNWSFETDDKKNRHVTLEKDVRVIFRTLHLGNILK